MASIWATIAEIGVALARHDDEAQERILNAVLAARGDEVETVEADDDEDEEDLERPGHLTEDMILAAVRGGAEKPVEVSAAVGFGVAYCSKRMGSMVSRGVLRRTGATRSVKYTLGRRAPG